MRARPAAIAVLCLALLVTPLVVVLLSRSDDPVPAAVRVDEIRLDALPTDITVANGRAWAADAGGNRLIAVDDRRAPGAPTRYPAPGGALRVATDPRSVWLTGAVGRSLSRFDSRFGSQPRRTDIALGADAVDVAVGGEGVWVSNGAQGTVTRIDPIARRPIGQPIHTGRFPTALAVGTHDVWVVNSGDGTLARVDQRENVVVGRRVPVGRDPQDVKIGFGSVWVANRGDGTIDRIDERTGRPLSRIRLGGGPNALDVTTRALLVLDSERGRVMRLDPTSERLTNVVHVRGFPSAFAVGEAGALWVVDARRGLATRISRGTDRR
jgi:DNA-binding beta-propeller fold protein YncE